MMPTNAKPPADRRAARRSSPTEESPSEVYRQIYVSLDLAPSSGSTVIGITSAISGEGRTTTAVGLAQTLADDLDVPIALVEVDLERPALAARFGVSPAPGLAEVLRDECSIEEAMRPLSGNLSLVTAGMPGADSGRLLHRLHVQNPFQDRGRLHGIVILDLPPIINHSYSRLVASVTDALVLVVRAGVTPAEVVREAIARLEDHPPQGVVFNGPRSSLPSWWPGRTFEIG